MNTNLGEKIYNVTATALAIAGQYGLSYEVRGDSKHPTGKLILSDRLQSDEDTVKVQRNEFFVKCPPDDADESAASSFLSAYQSGEEINLASRRLNALDIELPEERDSQFKFRIPKMLARGTFELDGEKKRDCLVYELVEKKHGLTIDKLHIPFEKSDDFLHFAKAFASAVKAIHNQGVVHSFIVPRNIFWNAEDRVAALVGFGYARLCDAGRRNSGLASTINISPVDNRFRAPECRDISRSRTAFWFPADIYSIGAILFYLLQQTTLHSAKLSILEFPPTDTKQLKSEIARILESHPEDNRPSSEASTLVHENENILKILDSCLRYNASERFSCIEELIEAIDIAKSAGKSTSNTPRKASQRTGAKRKSNVPLSHSVDPPAGLNVYFRALHQRLADDQDAALKNLTHGHFEVFGHRDRIVTSLCGLLGSANAGHYYRTMTLPDYWTDSNLGSMGRFLTMNKHMARRLVRIERLFLVSRHFHELPEEHQYILENQLAAVRQVNSEDPKHHFVIKVYREEDEAEIADFENEGRMVAYLSDKEVTAPYEQLHADGSYVGLNFYSTAQQSWSYGKEVVRRQINKVRYWNPGLYSRSERFLDNIRRFDQKWRDATTLDYYIYRGRDANSVPIEELLLPSK